MSTKRTAKKRTVRVNFDNEESIRKFMAKELDVDLEDVSIEENRGLSGFGAGTVYTVTSGREEYAVVRDVDAMEELALEVVKQDLENEPEIFSPDFIEQHIDTDHLRKQLWSDVYDGRYEDASEEARRKPIKFLEENGLDIPEPSREELRKYAEAMSDEENTAADILAKLNDMTTEDQWSEMGEDPEVTNKQIEEVAEEYTENQLKNPMDYLRDIYGDEAAKEAIEIAGLDIKEAAEAAIKEDGMEHFLCQYDGNYHEGPGGIVYWRQN